LRFCTTNHHNLGWRSTGPKQNYKLLAIVKPSFCGILVSELGHDVEAVGCFVYLGSCIDFAVVSPIRRRIELNRTCVKALDCNIWRSSINLQTDIRLWNVYILSILMYGAGTWTVTTVSSGRSDAFDQWCLRRILRIPYVAHVTNDKVRCMTGQLPVTCLII